MLLLSLYLTLALPIENPSTEVVNDKDIPTFVINLDRSPDRLATISEQLKQRDMSFKRFEATDGYQIRVDNLTKNQSFTGQDIKDHKAVFDLSDKYRVNCLYKDKELVDKSLDGSFGFVPTRWRWGVTAGEFGCICSHRQLWGYISKSDMEYAIILEDDVILEEGFTKADINKLINDLPEGWGVLYLGLHSGPKLLSKIDDSEKLTHKLNTPDGFRGTYAYVINPKSAAILYKYFEENGYPADIRLEMAINNNQITAYLPSYLLVTASKEYDSIIKEMGREFWNK